jgi:hypothetical protein
MTCPGLPGGRWSGIGTPLCGQRIRLRLPPPERRSVARLRASVGSTEASAGTGGAATPAASSGIGSQSDAGWFGLADSPFRSGCSPRPSF